jgi:hypothetical protein
VVADRAHIEDVDRAVEVGVARNAGESCLIPVGIGPEKRGTAGRQSKALRQLVGQASPQVERGAEIVAQARRLTAPPDDALFKVFRGGRIFRWAGGPKLWRRHDG